jgi:hypothetical protein
MGPKRDKNLSVMQNPELIDKQQSGQSNQSSLEPKFNTLMLHQPGSASSLTDY